MFPMIRWILSILCLSHSFALQSKLNPIQSIKESIYKSIDTIQKTPQILKETTGTVQQIPENIIENVNTNINAARNTVNSLQNSAKSTSNTVQDTVNNTISVISSIPNSVELTANFITAIPDEIVNIAENQVKAIQAIPTSVTSNIDAKVKDIKGTVVNVQDSVSNTVKDIKAIPDSIAAIPNSINSKINTIRTEIDNDISEKKGKVLKTVGLVKSIVTFPYEIGLKVVKFAKKFELSAEEEALIIKEKEQLLKEQALTRRAAVSSLTSLENAKETVYSFFDAIEATADGVAKTVEDIKKTPAKIEQVGRSVTNTVESVQRFGQSVVDVVEEVKRTPEKIQQAQLSVVRQVEDIKADVAAKQESLQQTGQFIWRVVTLEEAKDAYKRTATKVAEVKAQIDGVQAKVKGVTSMFQAKPQKESKTTTTSKKWLNPLDKIVGTLAAGKNAVETVKKDEYVQYLVSKKSDDAKAAPSTAIPAAIPVLQNEIKTETKKLTGEEAAKEAYLAKIQSNRALEKKKREEAARIELERVKQE